MADYRHTPKSESSELELRLTFPVIVPWRQARREEARCPDNMPPYFMQATFCRGAGREIDLHGTKDDPGLAARARCTVGDVSFRDLPSFSVPTQGNTGARVCPLFGAVLIRSSQITLHLEIRTMPVVQQGSLLGSPAIDYRGHIFPAGRNKVCGGGCCWAES